MTLTIQDYAARTLEKGADDLIQAALRLPEDKQEWQPLDRGRTALNQMAECAFLNGLFTTVVEQRAWSDLDREQMARERAALNTLDKAVATLRQNTARLAAAVRATPDEALGMTIALPPSLRGSRSLAECFLLPFWNMSYHEGQINYIASVSDVAQAPAP